MLLGLDLGTTNIKAILAQRDGRIVARGSAAVNVSYPDNLTVEQDIEDLWQATLSAIGQLTQKGDLSSVEAIGVSSQGGALQILDESRQPVGPVIGWLDGRGKPYDLAITEELGRDWFARHTGHGTSGLAVGQLLRLRHEQPQLLAQDHRVGFVGDVIVSRLCGTGATDATSLSIAVLFNPYLKAVDADLLARLGLRRDLLPRLLEPKDAAGGLSEQAAAETLLPAGVPVSPAVHDQYAASLGAGAVRTGDVMFSAGTAWVLLTAADKLVDLVIDDAFVCTHVVDGLYGQMLPLVNGGSCFSWALNVLGLSEESREQIDAMLESVPAGSDGLRCWPLLSPFGGARLPIGTAGRLTGLRLSHTPGHILRAVIEGLAMELERYLLVLKESGLAVERLVMCGGGANSRVTPQIVTDVTGMPVAPKSQMDTAALGAAMIARGLIEPEASLADLSEAMARPSRMVLPGAETSLYSEMLKEYLASLPAESSAHGSA
jgi:xylulokinase